MTAIASFEQLPIPGYPHGDTYVSATAPWRFVLHTTEGGDLEGNIGTYSRTGWFPHFTADLPNRRIAQHISIDESATAVSHKSSWPFQTNRWNCLQVEICGHAVESPGWSPADLEWLGAHLLAPVVCAKPIHLVAPTFYGSQQAYGASAISRMTPAEWNAFNGVCGHQHVPWDEHWDPGALNIGAVIAAAEQVIHPSAPIVPMVPNLAKGVTSDDGHGGKVESQLVTMTHRGFGLFDGAWKTGIAAPKIIGAVLNGPAPRQDFHASTDDWWLSSADMVVRAQVRNDYVVVTGKVPDGTPAANVPASVAVHVTVA